jgi:serine/threonine-protein kinase
LFGLILGLAVSGCGSLRETEPTWTPIMVTATPDGPILPIVATETPTATSVLLSTDISLLPTLNTTRTATPTLPAPITMTPSFTPTHTDTPVTQDAPGAFAAVGGAVGSGEGSSGECSTTPQGGFGAIYQGDSTTQTALGCPLTGSSTTANSAYQPFQNGVMIWLSSLGSLPQPVIYVLFNNGTYQRFNDTFQDGVDPASSGAQPPEGLLEPVRGFGKVWRESSGVRDTLGWASAGESGGSGQVLLFERGEMVYVSQAGQTYILITGAPGTWSARAGAP